MDRRRERERGGEVEGRSEERYGKEEGRGMDKTESVRGRKEGRGSALSAVFAKLSAAELER